MASAFLIPCSLPQVHMLILNADEVRKALPMREAIQAMKRAYADLSDGRAEVPLRGRLRIEPHDGLSLFMPAFVSDADGRIPGGEGRFPLPGQSEPRPGLHPGGCVGAGTGLRQARRSIGGQFIDRHPHGGGQRRGHRRLVTS